MDIQKFDTMDNLADIMINPINTNKFIWNRSSKKREDLVNMTKPHDVGCCSLPRKAHLDGCNLRHRWAWVVATSHARCAGICKHFDAYVRHRLLQRWCAGALQKSNAQVILHRSEKLKREDRDE